MSKINVLTQTGKTNIMLIGAMCLLAGLMLAQQVSAINLVDQLDQSAASGKSSVAVAVVENPELVARVLDNLLRSILFSANADYQVTNSLGTQKRGLDLGISRGFSGSQAGKHLMGLSAASFANGPGRR